MKKVFLIVLVIACVMRLQPVALAQEVSKLPRSTPRTGRCFVCRNY